MAYNRLMKHMFKLMGISILAGIILALIFLTLNISPHNLQGSFFSFIRLPAYQQIESSLNHYFDAWIKGDPKTMYTHLSNKDRLIVTLDKYILDFNAFPVHPESLKIMHIKIKNNYALVTTKITWPQIEDFSPQQKGTQLFVLIKENGQWKITEQETFQ